MRRSSPRLPALASGLERWLPLRPPAARLVAVTVAVGRLGLGGTALVAPAAALRLWVGDDDVARPAARVLARALGGRDVALASGALAALAAGRPLRPWVVAGAVADAGDVTATMAAWRALPRARRWTVACLAAGAAAAGAMAAPACDGG